MGAIRFFSKLLLVTPHVVVFAHGTTSGETTPALFNYENTQLSDGYLQTDGADLISKDIECKYVVGDPEWPSNEDWSKLNSTLDGTLLKPAPAASVCYNNTMYNNFASSKCEAISTKWPTNFERAEDPIEVNSPVFQGLTCIPPTSLNTNGCTQGGYPVYVVNVSSVPHIQAAINFARTRKIRLVVKNTGHDMSGRSLGGGALSVWTHYLKDIVYYSNYTTVGYQGPAFKAGAGVQAKEIYKFAFDRGLMVVGGVCDSVGLFGGYSQGGGHSMLSSLHGMGADQVLSIQVVTADGKFVTASTSENTDLFWALRGGGASSFGVVTSMVIKAFKDVESTVGTVEWGVGGNNISVDTFWKGVSSYFSYSENFTKEGTAAQWNMFTNNFPSRLPPDGQPRLELTPFFAPGKNLEQAKSITAPWLADMKSLGINITMNWTYYPSYYTAYYSVFSTTSNYIMPYAMGYASRLVPRENFDKSKKLNITVAAYRKLLEDGHSFNGFQYAPTLEAGSPLGPNGNAIHPSWREALSHTIIFAEWPANATAQQQIEVRERFATQGMKQMRDAMPGAGSYMNEGDRLELDFQQSFYGVNYPRLLEIKKKYDPEDVFWAATAVGSEGWAVRSADGLPNENGPLCRVTNSSIATDVKLI